MVQGSNLLQLVLVLDLQVNHDYMERSMGDRGTLILRLRRLG